jgi:hypothetical protein
MGLDELRSVVSCYWVALPLVSMMAVCCDHRVDRYTCYWVLLRLSWSTRLNEIKGFANELLNKS